MRVMLKLLGLLVLAFGVFASAMGGVLAYSRRDPQYSCISFDNITIQLDTSLFVRSRFPLYTSYNVSPDGDHRVFLEMTSPILRRTHPLNASELYYEDNHAAVIQSSQTTERIVLEQDVYGSEFYEIWWPQNKRLTYNWRSYSDMQMYLTVYDTENFQHLLTIPMDSNYGVLGWTADGRYAVLTNPDSSPSLLEVVDTFDGKSQSYDLGLGINIAYVGYPTFWEHRITFLWDEHVFVIDLEEGTQENYSITAPQDLPPQDRIWSPTGQYLYLTYSGTNAMEMFVLDINDDLKTVFQGKYPTGVYAQYISWGPGDENLFYTVQTPNQQTLHKIDLKTGEDKTILPNYYRAEVQSNGQVLYSIRNRKSFRLYQYDPPTDSTQKILETEGELEFYWVTPDALMVTEYNSDPQDMYLPTRLYIFDQEGQGRAKIPLTGTATYQINPYQNSLIVIDTNMKEQRIESAIYALETGEKLPLPDIPIGNTPVYNSLYGVPESNDWLILTSETTAIVPQTTVYRIDGTTGELVWLADLPMSHTSYSNFVWSPDGEYATVTFQPSQPGFELAIIEMDGGGWRSLGRFEGYPSLIQWTKCTY